MKRLCCIAFWLLAALLPVGAREVAITILHTTDLHGNILPTTDYEGRTNVGGFARCATAIRQVRAREKNVLVVDAGDTIQGTAASWLSGGQVMVKALNALRYDAWVPGNHEFDWGLAKLTACVARAEMPVVAANISTGFVPFVVREFEGVKVAIIGLTTPGIPNWSRPRLLGGLRFADSVATLKSVIPAAQRAGAQVLVLVVHQGHKEGGDDHGNQVGAVTRNFPELDVVIGAHSHRDIPEFLVNRVLYSQAAYYGKQLGRVDLVFDSEKRMVTRRSAKSMVMDETVALDAAVVKLAEKELAAAEQHLAERLGEATAEFTAKGGPKRPTAVHDLICAAIAEALRVRGTKVDAVLHGILSPKASLAAGPITMADVWRLVPFENTVGVARVSGAALREILEENAGAYEKPEFRGLWGLPWEFDAQADAGQRVRAIRRLDGSGVGETDTVLVAFNSFDLASGGLRCPKLRATVERPESSLVEHDFTTREALVEYVRRQGRVTPLR